MAKRESAAKKCESNPAYLSFEAMFWFAALGNTRMPLLPGKVRVAQVERAVEELA